MAAIRKISGQSAAQFRLRRSDQVLARTELEEHSFRISLLPPHRKAVDWSEVPPAGFLSG